MDRRLGAGLVVGLLGLALGAVGSIWDDAAIAVLGAALLLVGGVAVVRLVGLLRRATNRIDELTGMVSELEEAVEEESKARVDVEQQLSSRIMLTAMRRGTLADALTDAKTGLYNEGYFTVALDARIAAARRSLRPLAAVVLEVVEGLAEGHPKPADAERVAASIAGTVREADTACRLLDGGYALILEDTSETGAIWTVERIRRHMATNEPGLTMWAGIACYPAHGMTTDEVLDRADHALDAAREWRQDRIEVATAAME